MSGFLDVLSVCFVGVFCRCVLSVCIVCVLYMRLLEETVSDFNDELSRLKV